MQPRCAGQCHFDMFHFITVLNSLWKFSSRRILYQFSNLLSLKFFCRRKSPYHKLNIIFCGQLCRRQQEQPCNREQRNKQIISRDPKTDKPPACHGRIMENPKSVRRFKTATTDQVRKAAGSTPRRASRKPSRAKIPRSFLFGIPKSR